jgi:hypothetical protein
MESFLRSAGPLTEARRESLIVVEILEGGASMRG